MRHTFTRMHATSASRGSPSHTGHESVPYAPMSPSRLSTQLNTLNWESYIHFQPSTLMATGRVNGITTSARTIFLPRKFWSRRNARLVPRMLLRMAATTKKTTLFRRAIQNVSISRADLKFSRPTKLATCSPTLASLSAR